MEDEEVNDGMLTPGGTVDSGTNDPPRYLMDKDIAQLLVQIQEFAPISASTSCSFMMRSSSSKVPAVGLSKLYPLVTRFSMNPPLRIREIGKRVFQWRKRCGKGRSSAGNATREVGS